MEEQSELRPIDPNLIDFNEYNPREFNENDPKEIERLEHLKQSISDNTILVPLIVFEKGKRFELLDGERRLRAARALNLKEVPAHVFKSKKGVFQALKLMSNIHMTREEWGIEEQIKNLDLLRKLYRKEEGKEPSKNTLQKISGLKGSKFDIYFFILNLPENMKEKVFSKDVKYNYFPEMKKTVSAYRNHFPKLFKDKGGEEKVKRILFEKITSGTITNNQHFRLMSKLINELNIAATHAENANQHINNSRIIAKKFLSTKTYSYKDAYNDALKKGLIYSDSDFFDDAENFYSQLTKYKSKFGTLDPKFKNILKKIKDFLDRALD
ncbi:ParB/RepB/Spo0J family partition protein [Candidatus Altiarchaeota archaeon]